MVTRRNFLKFGVVGPSICVATLNAPHLLWGANDKNNEALYYVGRANRSVDCQLCDNKCQIDNGKTGICKSRVNRNGHLYSLNHNRPVAIHLDPIEKLPMKHVLPGKNILCIGTGGCNFSCKYCYNDNISQKSPLNIKGFSRTPKDIIRMNSEANSDGIAFTYNEPTVAYEFMLEVFKLAKNNGIKTFLHTNGSMQKDPLLNLLQHTDGVVVDLKSFSSGIHKNLTGNNNIIVKENLKHIHRSNTFLEIANLVVPGFNDDIKEIESLCSFIKNELSSNVPIHFSRFYPNFKLLNLPPTPTKTILSSIETGRRNSLNYVYANNVRTSANDTYCPVCNNILIKRSTSKSTIDGLKNGQCVFCKERIPGIWEA